MPPVQSRALRRAASLLTRSLLFALLVSSAASSSRAHYYLGGIYWGEREYRKAADELEPYLKLSPHAPDAEQVRGSIKELRSK
jgi:regulator of sirC expression with transglutaminase-like and TPR domain